MYVIDIEAAMFRFWPGLLLGILASSATLAAHGGGGADDPGASLFDDLRIVMSGSLDTAFFNFYPSPRISALLVSKTPDPKTALERVLLAAADGKLTQAYDDPEAMTRLLSLVLLMEYAEPLVDAGRTIGLKLKASQATPAPNSERMLQVIRKLLVEYPPYIQNFFTLEIAAQKDQEARLALHRDGSRANLDHAADAKAMREDVAFWFRNQRRHPSIRGLYRFIRHCGLSFSEPLEVSVPSAE